MVTEPFTPSRPRRGRRLVVAGVVVAVVALVVGVTSGVLVAMAVGTPVSKAFTNPTRPTPVDEQLSLEAGRYTVFELVGRRSGQGPVTTTTSTSPTVTPEAIALTGPDGVTITARGYTSGSETLTRDRDIYAAVARFVVTEPGRYHVRIDSPAATHVVIAPSFGSGFGAAVKWVLAGLASFVALVAGVVLVVVGAVRGRRPPVQVAPASGPYSGQAFTPAGWYRAPDVAGRERYWNGHSWTEHLR